MFHVRRFNRTGLDRFAELLDALGRDASSDEEVGALLQDESLTETLTDTPAISATQLGTRRQTAEMLHRILEPVSPRVADLERDAGLWGWLSLLWLDELAPKTDNGTRSVAAHYRYIPAVDNFRHYYRHYLAGPFRIYRAHLDDPDRAMAVLATSTTSPGDVVEQLASRQEVITSSGLMAAATSLYFDRDTGDIKRGAAGRGGGSARRLPIVLAQFDLTFDIYGMDADGILALLPREFDRFKGA